MGNDTLIGGGGGDTMSGHAAGAVDPTDTNTYIYNVTTDSRADPGNFDTITDFVHGLDEMDLSAIAGFTSVVSTTSVPATIAAHVIELVAAGGNTVLYSNTLTILKPRAPPTWRSISLE